MFNSFTANEIICKLHTIEQSSRYRSYLVSSFLTLTPIQHDLAKYGIERHLYYCEKLKIEPSTSALREIIMDARHGMSIARENQIDTDRSSKTNNLRGYFALSNQTTAKRVRVKRIA